VGVIDDPKDAATQSSHPDASVFATDGPARVDASASVTDGPAWVDALADGPQRVDGPIAPTPTDGCPPTDGDVCGCGGPLYGAAPFNDAGQPLPVVTPDPTQVVAYHTMDEFDALAVGRWRRTAGQAELICEQLGVEFTADHRLLPLVGVSDSYSEQLLSPDAQSFSISFEASPPRLMEPGFTTSAPIFFDGGRSMYFLYAPWPANYVRLP
jgi:hypothetical protein